jgi:hypothetical protein
MSYFLFLHTGIVLVRLFVAVAMHEGNKGERISLTPSFKGFSPWLAWQMVGKKDLQTSQQSESRKQRQTKRGQGQDLLHRHA